VTYQAKVPIRSIRNLPFRAAKRVPVIVLASFLLIGTNTAGSTTNHVIFPRNFFNHVGFDADPIRMVGDISCSSFSFVMNMRGTVIGWGTWGSSLANIGDGR
jgi:hypothetical protein